MSGETQDVGLSAARAWLANKGIDAGGDVARLMYEFARDVVHDAVAAERERANTAAAQDVLAERQRQIDKGYTPEHDDEHSLSRIIGYGGWKWYPPTYGSVNAAKTRAEMVRLAACLLAGIEWLDRRAEDES